MKTIEFLSYLHGLDVKLWAEGDQLRCNAPDGVLTPALQGELKQRKEAILTLLKARDAEGHSRISPIERVEQKGPLPLSFAQQRLWFLHQLEPESHAYNSPLALRLQGPVDVAALRQALQALVDRHETLRTSFPTADGQPSQVIADSLDLPWNREDLRKGLEAGREAIAQERIQSLARRPFDLATGPLIRVHLLQLGDADYVLLITLHHIISDGWSLGVVSRELAALYDAFVHQRPSSLAPLPIQYVDFAYWQRRLLAGEVLEQQLGYWRQHLSDLASSELPTDRPRPPRQTYNGARHFLHIEGPLTDGVHALSQRAGVSLAITLLAAFQVLLSRCTGQTDIAVGSPIANRNRLEIEGLVGFFVNSLVMRTDLSGDPSFLDVLKRVQQVSLAAYDHQDLPFEQLVDELQLERDPSRNPLFQVMFAVHNAPAEAFSLSGVTVQPFAQETTTTRFDLEGNVWERDKGLQVVWVYNTDLFDAATIERFSRHFQQVLKEVVRDPRQRLSRIPLLSQDEHQQLLVDWAATQKAYPRAATLAERFEAQASATPDGVALVFEGLQLTYRELNERADQLARYLQRDHGVGPEVRVGLYLPRSVEMIVGVLGIIKAGGAYVPLDPNAPPGRLAFILEDADVTVVLSRDDEREALPSEWTGPVIALDAEWPTIAETPAMDLASGATAESLAYIMYTSGSTGLPKGTSICQRSVMRLVMNTNYLEFGPDETFLQFAPLAFDASTLEIWGSLLHGSKLVVYPPHQASLEELGRCLKEHEISTLWLTAAIFHQMVDSQPEALSGVRQLLSGGDVLSVPHVQRVLANLPAGGALINGYGPTENTTFTCCHVMTRESRVAGSVPIGRPIANTQVYVLDRSMQPVPVGVYGELYIGGDGLARDYLKRPALTAEKFVPHPFSDTPGARLYRTGDLVRYRSDGTVEFQGRQDHQVKLRGFRIELGEIEAALCQHTDVKEAIVVLREEPTGEKRLAGYVVSSNEALSPSELSRHLKQTLPDYMVPAILIRLDALPVTPNGKVDRKALPDPDDSWLSLSQGFVPPRNPVEEILAEVWRSLLRVRQVGVHDNFFELGGHSLLATQIISRVREILHVDVPLRHLFEGPTIESLAAVIESVQRTGHASTVSPLVPCSRTDPLPLSFAQQRLWFLQQLEPGSTAYSMPYAVRLRGALDVAAITRSLNELVKRHESLRTVIAQGTDDPIQVILPSLQLPVPVVDLQSLPEAEREAEVQRLCAQEAQTPFDLAAGPLIRAQVVRMGADDHAVLLTLHHIISDGWSMGVFFKELEICYKAFCEGQAPVLPPLPVQYADYAAWQRQSLQGEALEAQLEYWRRQLGPNLPVLELPTDHPRPAVQSFAGAQEPHRLSKSLLDSLRSLSQGEGATLFMALLAGLKALFHRYSGQSVITIGTPVANRSRSELESLIGFFVNSLVLNTELEGELSFREALARVREVSLGAYAHQDLPFEQLVEAVNPVRDQSRHPLFQVMFALQNMPLGGMELQGLRLGALPAGRSSSQFDLTLFAREDADGLRLIAEYNTDLFEAKTIRRLLGHYETLLAGIVADPEQAISRLPLLREAERQQLLLDWNATEALLPRDACIHDLVDGQAGRTPDAVALVSGEDALTYTELNTRANHLARYLQQHYGVGPEVCVGVCMERSADMLVAILGILKAGGAYVPLDPNYPAMRLAYILEDAGVGVLLTQERLVAELPESQARVVCVDTDPACLPTGPVTAPDSQATASNLAYLIYTSGSTGQPKGVAIEHRSAVALVQWAKGWFGEEELRGVLASTSMCFDLSVFEMFVPLSAGGTVILAESILDLLDLPNAEDVTLINTVPSGIAALLRRSGLPDSVRTVNLAGEPLKPQLVKQIEKAGRVERVYDLYGPSEDTTYSTGTLRRGDGPEIIGRPIANTQAYVLDGNLQPVPVGVPGDLYLGGEGLTRGYYHRPDLTAEKFIPNPYSDQPGARLYKTGDLARYLADGTIKYLGRQDHQVKVRGYRIELGEIETALGELPEIKDVVVVVREAASDDKRIVAYMVPSDGPLSSSELRRTLKRRLPDYMVPAHFVMLDALPLTPNGKVDRKALPDPDANATDLAENYVSPRDPVEEILVQIWEDLLGVKRVGIHDNFFDLGGHSLLAAKIVARVRAAYGVDIPLRAFFDAPTIAGLSEALTSARHGEKSSDHAGITPIPRDGALPLSYAQERFWILDQIHTEPGVYNISYAFRMRGPLRLGVFRQSVQALFDRHEILRTTFPSLDGESHPVIAANLPVEVPLQDCSGLATAEQDGKIQQALHEAERFQFDLAQGPFLRTRLLRFAEDDHCLILNFHHIINDAWSLEVIIKDLVAAYTAGCADQRTTLPALPVQYVDYANWQRELVKGPAGQEQLAYWKKQLAQLPPPIPLPTDYRRPAIQTFRGARENIELPVELMTSIRALNREEGTTLFMVFLAALQFLLHRLTGTQDILIGSVIAGRDREELQGLIGCFLNTLVLRTELSGDLTGRDLLKRVREVVLSAYENQDVPFEKILAEVQPERDRGRTPIFQVLLNMHSFDDQRIPLPELSVTRVPAAGDKSLFDMTLYFVESANRIMASLSYNADLFAPARMKEFMQQLQCILEQIASEPDRPLEAISLVTPSARSYLPDPSVPLAAPRQPLVTELIGRWTLDAPEHAAVRQGSQQWSYRDLADQAERLGRSLTANGVKNGAVVALSGRASFGLIVGMLGVLQRGGVLLMVDPALPDARKSLMLDEANAQVILLLRDDDTDVSWEGCEKRPKVYVSPRTGDVESANTPMLSITESEPSPPVGDPAYIFFTSGTTGKPKGIVGSHQSLSHFLTWQRDTFGITPGDRAAQLTGLSFDVVLRDIFLPLISGGVLCLPEEADMLDGARVLQWLHREHITVMHTVPAVASSWLATVAKDIPLSTLQWVFFAGEPLTDQLVRKWRSAIPGSGELVNLYGPTETTLAKCFYQVPETPPIGVQPIGEPLPNTQVLIMNRARQLCGMGELGEIVVRTPFRSLGPLPKQEPDGRFFQKNPYRPGASEELYFTGDLGRYRPDGTVEILGRLDEQVKIRGVRIEPNEVMTTLATHPSVHTCFVMARKDVADSPALVAYVVPSANASPTASELRAHVAGQLPSAMVPSSYVLMESFRYTPNGKIDRKALPLPDTAGEQLNVEFVAPRTPIEVAIGAIWKEVLKLDRVGIYDNFFDLGGHSLLATQVVARVRDSLHVDLKLRHVFEVPVLKEMAGMVGILRNSTQDLGSSAADTGEDRSEIVL